MAETVSEHMVVRGAGWSIGDRSAPHIRGSVRFDDPLWMEDYLRSMTSLPGQIDKNQGETSKKLSEMSDKLDRLLREPVGPSVDQFLTASHQNQMEDNISKEGDSIKYGIVDENHSFYPFVAVSS